MAFSAVTLQLGPDTKALAYALFDRAVFSMKVKKHHISVLAATCLMIATKLLEDHVCRDLGKFLIRQANLTFGKVKVTLGSFPNSFSVTLFVWKC